MQKVSKITKTLIFGQEISLAVLDTTSLVGEAIFRHSLSPVAAAALGRTLTATAYLCSWLKGETSSLYTTVAGNGPGGKIFAAGDGLLNLRGHVEHPFADLPLRSDGKLDVGGYVGRGTLTVVRDEGEGIPFVGTCELISGEIAEDFSQYFLVSEQRPTAVALGVLISPKGICLGAGGIFLQPLPGASEESISFAEEKIMEFRDLSSKISQMGAEGILKCFGAEKAIEREIRFRCRCNRERAASAVVSMGKREALELCRERGSVTVHCPDCSADYDFNEKEITELFS